MVEFPLDCHIALLSTARLLIAFYNIWTVNSTIENNGINQFSKMAYDVFF